MHTRAKSKKPAEEGLSSGPFVHFLMSGDQESEKGSEEDGEGAKDDSRSFPFSSQEPILPSDVNESDPFTQASWDENADCAMADPWEASSLDESKAFWSRASLFEGQGTRKQPAEDPIPSLFATSPVEDGCPQQEDPNETRVRQGLQEMSLHEGWSPVLLGGPEEEDQTPTLRPPRNVRKEWESSTLRHHCLQLSLEEVKVLCLSRFPSGSTCVSCTGVFPLLWPWLPGDRR